MTSSADLVLLEKSAAGVAVLTLNRAEKLNAFAPPMIAALNRALEDAVADDGIRVLVLTGAGRAFCAGGDAADIAGRHREEIKQRWDYYARDIHRVARTLERMATPIIAAVDGAARGAGLDFALLCDLRICGRSSTFAESYVDLGLIAGAGGTFALPRLVGVARALELFWTGRVVDAAEAAAIGLVNRVVEDDRVLAAARELAEAIAAKPPAAVKLFRRAVYQSLTMPLATHLDLLASHMTMLHGTEQHVRAVRERFGEPRGS